MRYPEGPQELYGVEWQKKRAFDSLKRIGDREWDFSDSLLLYTSAGEAEYEEMQEEENPYNELVTAPERAYLQEVAERIVAELPDEFEYIDLGPGTEHKEQFFFDACKKLGKKFKYVPVDISISYLEASRTYARSQGIDDVTPVRASFEELPEPSSRAPIPRFVSLGLTYSNYDPEVILPLLKRIAGPRGYVFINSQIRDRTDMSRIQDIYGGMKGMCKGKLELLGMNVDTDVTDFVSDDGIRVWCTVVQPSPKLEAKGIKAGDRLLLLQSLRPTKESLEGAVAHASPSYSLHDTNGPFIAGLLKPTVRVP